MDEFIKPTFFLDYESSIVQNFIKLKVYSHQSEAEKVISLYYGVRDEIKYDPYHIVLKKENLRASSVLSRGYGYCVEKALLLVACVRAIGIPSKIGFANVKNHLTSKRLYELMRSDIFVFHGYADILLNNSWVKATPAFNRSLCEKTNTLPLEFDGISDSIFHPIDKSGKKHMEYIHDYGSFSDLPFDNMLSEYIRFYPHLKIDSTGTFGPVKIHDEFENEAVREL